MNKIPVHYLPTILCRMFLRHDNLVKCFNFHQSNGGWTTVLKCGMTGIEYKMELTPIQSEVKAGPLTVDEVLGKGGFFD